jgi:hypothetical protein
MSKKEDQDMGLIDANGRHIGTQPVVAHVLTVNRAIGPEELQSILAGWQRMFGVPAVVLAGGVEVVASILADGELCPLPMDPEMTIKVQALLDDRVARVQTEDSDPNEHLN